MGEIILESNEIDNNLKKIKFRMIISIIFFIIFFVIGFLFLFFSLSINPESELWAFITIILTTIIVLVGVFILYLPGYSARKILFYYKRIKPLQFDHISINSKFIMSIKDQIYIMFLGIANGVYYIKLENNNDFPSLDKKPKKRPHFIIRLNKKIKFDNITVKVGEFSGFFKIPLNKRECIIGDAKVFFMPLATFLRGQGSTEIISKMFDMVKEKHS